jgi:signal transduction histidine kinase
LEKLRSPQLDGPLASVPVANWWSGVQHRYAREPWLNFVASEVDWDRVIPEQAFSAVLDNLLANVSDKRSREPAVTVAVTLANAGAGVSLSVCDTGTPVPERQRANLFARPVESRNGLGIGLYQANQLALASGYEVVLATNNHGRVCFVLRPQSEP